jgi:uncharacterized protein (TIGR02099 family)
MLMLKTIFRRAKTLFWTAFSIVVILLAVGVGLGKLLMPYSVHYQPELEQWLSEQFGQPVSIDSFEGDWTAFGPRLTLRGLKLLEDSAQQGEGAAEVVIESAALDLRPLNYLLAGQALYNFRVIGADFELRRDANGELTLSGFGVSNRDPGRQRSALGDLARVGEVFLQDSSLAYTDELLDIRLGLTGINGRVNLEGSEFSAEVRAVLFDARSTLQYGNIDATAVLSLDREERIEAAEWHLEASELMLASFQGKIPHNRFLPLTGWLDAETWGGWSRGGGHRINGSFELSDALLVNRQQDYHIDRANSMFRWRFKGGGHWNLHLADFFFDLGENAWTSPRLSVARNVAEGSGLWISADELPLGVPLNLVRDVMSLYDRAWPEGLPVSADGQVSELDLVLNEDWSLQLARGRISNASVSDWKDMPGVTGLDGEIHLRDGNGQFRLSGDAVRIDWPRMFAETLEFDLARCPLEIHWGENWSAGVEGCALSNPDLAVQGDLFLFGGEGKPSLDANFAVTRLALDRIDPYWPLAVMPENVLGWLQRGIVGGELELGRFQIHGDMDDWPFRNAEGRFEAVAWLREPVIDYLDGWPPVTGNEITARFIGASMDIGGSVKETAGVPVDEVRASIDDMKAPRLEITYSSAGDLPGLLDFFQASPLDEQVNVDLSQFDLAGPADISGRITVPLGKTGGELEVDGAVLVKGGRFRHRGQDFDISDIRGLLRFTERGFFGNDLGGVTLGEAITIDLRADADSEEKFRANMIGQFDAQQLLVEENLSESLLMLQAIEGRSDWLASVVVMPDGAGGETQATFLMQSDLRGVTIDLPAPFNKRADEAWPFQLTLPMQDDGRPADIVFAQRGGLRLDLGAKGEPPNSILMNLGPFDAAAELPPAGLMRIAGSAATLDLDGWIDRVVAETEASSGMGGLALETSRFGAEEMLFIDRKFPGVALEVSVSEDGFGALFESQDIDGRIRFNWSGTGPANLSAEFERLVLGEPESAGMTMETDPKELPALHLYVRSLSYLDIELGETRIEAYPTATGMRFEKVDAASSELSIQASGDWSLAEGGHRSDFSINMASESLGDFLHSMDISSSVQGGQTLVNFDAWWQGTPGSFALSRLNGELEFGVIDGNITGADAGPGRLLGLVSFTALPKRLSLDFRDVFESGFSFDEATGSFTLENGVARTDDVLLKSSSASISVSGRTDLVERQYDQLMTIRPGVGNTLPLIGALAAGPPGAAAGLALQGLLQDELAEASRVSYTITGSWDEPQIEPVEVERAGE